MKKLVVLGAGIGGLSVIDELKQRRCLDGGELEVTLIDKDFTHFIGFTLPWIMRGWRTPQQASIAPSRQFLRGVKTVTGTVTAVDSQRRTVRGDDFDISYDALIVALGAKNNLGAIPGLREANAAGTCHHFYSIEDAAKAHDALAAFAGGKIVMLIPSLPFRCPPAPYEGAMLIADYLKEQGRRQDTQIDVYTVEPRPMPAAGPSPGPQVEALLSGQEIGFHPNMRCEGIDVASKKIEFAEGASADFDLLFCVPPHRASLSLNGEQNWIAVDNRTLATEHDGIWAIGDVAGISTPSGTPLPKAAIMAKGHATTAVDNVLQYLDLVPAGTTFGGYGYCIIDIGDHKAARGVGNFYALPAPAVELGQPSTALHEFKEDEERDWTALVSQKMGSQQSA
jgi:sulfide:quinone oxidoreductase